MFKKFLIPLFAVMYLLGCGESTDQLLNEQHDHLENVYTETTHKIEENDTEHTDENNQKIIEEKSDLEQKSEQSKKRSSLADLKVHYIDAGQADATLFQYTDEDEDYTILYDTGDWNQNDVVNYLTAQDVHKIDLVIVSHPHADHIGQLADIINSFEVGEVWLSENTSSSKTFQKAVEAIMASDADYYEPHRGETFEIGPMDIEVLHPETLTGDLNKDSLSLRFVYGDVKFIFTGDAYKKQELEMVQSGMDVEADIIQLGHHGSNTSSDQTFLKAVNPQVAIYSAGQDNLYGHPHDKVVSRINHLNIDLYGTDVHGTIVVTTNGVDFDILTKEDGTISPSSTEEPINDNEQNNEQNNDQAQLTEETNNNTEDCIDINNASIEEVQNIIHIGSVRAKDLIDQRPFETVDDLSRIKGIGPARIADIKEQSLACVGG